ncbi:hypothetical protein VI817_006073 [Penicillium citrinum]|uniref:Uncharacterized protein n=1 Tax=Penicillium hetheringtonii TaxID=911720 RepID=A0AAD6GQW5_9EURO|nr:hypothetical protein N7450_006536 [Penicillium hetheringtonii]KAK5796789.1 hypothetical protein VI817_006073 [Penicillium citrinum]
MASAIPSTDPEPSRQGQPSRLYRISRPAFHMHYEVKTDDDRMLYYTKVSVFGINKPDMTMHAGDSPDAPIVAACKFLKLSRHYKLALGDPGDLRNVQWEDMISHGSLHSKLRFSMKVPDKHQPGYNERRAFLWKRTHSEAAEGSAPLKASMRNFKLVDEKTGNVVAVFNREISFSKCGVLEIKADFGQDFDIMVINSCVGQYERIRRRNSSGGGGGGGGGG